MNQGDVRDMSHLFLEYGTTNIHPITVVFMLCMVGLTLSRPPSRPIFAFLLVCVFMPLKQRLVLVGLDFNMMRLILIVAWARILVRGEYRGLRLERIDRLFLLWTASGAILYVLRVGSSGVVRSLGTGFDALTVFFLFRALVRRREGVFLVSRQLAWIVVVLTPFIAYELATHVNAFSVFGSAPLISAVRGGRVRCQGPFSHPILLGTFGSVLLPIFIGMLGRGRRKLLTGLAIVGATVITVASGSSGPVLSWALGVLGWGLWFLRKRTRWMLGATAALLFLLHVIREKPVWHLIGRVSSLTGGTGFHRYRLIDAFVDHFSEWALVGTSNTMYWGWGLQDTTNQYVAEGVSGGLLTLILFLLLLQASFSSLRRSREVFESMEGPQSLWTRLAWGFSVSLAAHCVSFVSVSYFGQTEQFFFSFLALIPALSRFQRRVGQPASSRPVRPTIAARAEPTPAGV